MYIYIYTPMLYGKDGNMLTTPWIWGCSKFKHNMTNPSSQDPKKKQGFF